MPLFQKDNSAPIMEPRHEQLLLQNEDCVAVVRWTSAVKSKCSEDAGEEEHKKLRHDDDLVDSLRVRSC